MSRLVGRFSKVSLLLVALLALGTAQDLRAEGAAEAPEPAKGPHGGRLLSEGAFQVEVTIFERGVPPEYRVFVYENGKPLDPAAVNLQIKLHRLAGRVDTFAFTKRGDFLRGDKEVEEPHSFDVHVQAEWNGKRHEWTYDSYEGRTQISDHAAKEAGIATETVGPATIGVKLPLTGRVIQDDGETVHVSARYPGVVKSVRKRLGERVRQGEVLAVVEGNASLNTFEIRSPVAGTITRRDISVGEVVAERDALFEVSNLDQLLVELQASRDDYRRLRVGQPVEVDLGDGGPRLTTTLSYLSPVGSARTQSVLVRAAVANTDGRLLPGLFVRADVLVEMKAAALAVKKSGLQTFRDWEVVFLQDGDRYEIRPLELGAADDEWVEVLGGIEHGQSYVTSGSFVVKADVGKSGASHDH